MHRYQVRCIKGITSSITSQQAL